MGSDHVAAVGLGSNLGDKAGWIREAVQKLSASKDIEVLEVSPFYRTAPVGVLDQDWFVNAALTLCTEKPPRDLLALLLAIEEDLGRVRTVKWGPRNIDLDLLFYDGTMLEEKELTLPHPFLDSRMFVLVPLRDVAPEWIHPRTGLTPAQMIDGMTGDGQEVTRL